MPFIFIYKDRYKIIISYLCCFLIFCPNNSSLSLFHHLSAVQETFLLVKIFCVFIFLLFHISPLPSPYLPSPPPSPGLPLLFMLTLHTDLHISLVFGFQRAILYANSSRPPLHSLPLISEEPCLAGVFCISTGAPKDGSILAPDESGQASGNRCVSW